MKLVKEIKTNTDMDKHGLTYYDTDDPYVISVYQVPHCRACMANKFNVMIPLILRHGFPTIEHPMQRIPAM